MTTTENAPTQNPHNDGTGLYGAGLYGGMFGMMISVAAASRGHPVLGAIGTTATTITATTLMTGAREYGAYRDSGHSRAQALGLMLKDTWDRVAPGSPKASSGHRKTLASLTIAAAAFGGLIGWAGSTSPAAQQSNPAATSAPAPGGK